MVRQVRRRTAVAIVVTCMTLLVVGTAPLVERMLGSSAGRGSAIAYIDHMAGYSQGYLPGIMLYKNGRSQCVAMFSRSFWILRLLGYNPYNHRWICVGEDSRNDFVPVIVSVGKDGERITRLQGIGEGEIYDSVLVGNHIWIPRVEHNVPSLMEYGLDGRLLLKRVLDVHEDAKDWEYSGAAVSTDGSIALAISKDIEQEDCMYIFDKAGKRLTTLGQGRYPVFDSSGNRLLFTSHDSIGKIYDLKTRQLHDVPVGRPTFAVSNYLPIPITGLLSLKWGAMPDTFVVQYERWYKDHPMYSAECKEGESCNLHYLMPDVNGSWIVVPDAEL